MAGNLKSSVIGLIVAFAASTALITGAYFLAKGTGHPAVAEAATETAVLQAIATKDSDGDGLPDWEEALYGTDPHNTDTRKLGMTDEEAVTKGLIVAQALANVPDTSSGPSDAVSVDPSLPPPSPEGTLTDTFAKNFFTLYLSEKEANGGADLTQEDTQRIAQTAMSQISQVIAPAPDFKSVSNLTVSDSGADALRAFAASAEKVLKANGNDGSKSELLYLQDFLVSGDASALPHLVSIANDYRTSASGLAALSVPKDLATPELALVNAMARVGEISDDFSRVNTDPMAAMFALQQYPQAVTDLGSAFINIGKVYSDANVTLTDGTPGAAFVNLMKNVAAKQKAAAPPQKAP